MTDFDTKIIGERIAFVRKEHGLSLDALAQRAGLSKSHVWEMEQGRSVNPTVLTMTQIAEALQVSMVWLVHGKDDQFKSGWDAAVRSMKAPIDEMTT